MEWVVKDDQSKPDLARTLYEQLVTADKVDLLMGPYATGAILSAMGVAQRYNKVLVHHTLGIPSLAKYEHAVPGLVARLGPGRHGAQHACSTRSPPAPKPPKTVAVVTSKFPSIHFMSLGAREVLKKRGLNEVLFLEWDFGNRDFGPIATRVKDAKPDFVWVGAIGLDGNLLLDAMKKIDYAPPQHFYLYPAPGPLVDAARGEERAVGDDLRGAAAVHRATRARPSSSSSTASAPTKAGLPDTSVETQAAASYTAWQILEAGVVGDQEPRRQGDRRLAQGEPGRHDPGQAALRRRRQLRRRPDARSSRCRTASGSSSGRRK